MTSVINEKIYNIILISKDEEQIRQKKLKKILKILRNITEEDLKEFSELKIKIFEVENINPKIPIAAPIIGFQHYFEDFKKLNSRQIVNNNDDNEDENTLSNVDDNEEEIKQVDSSDFSEDE